MAHSPIAVARLLVEEADRQGVTLSPMKPVNAHPAAATLEVIRKLLNNR